MSWTQNDAAWLERIATALEQLAMNDVERLRLLRESNSMQIESMTRTIEHNTKMMELFAPEQPSTAPASESRKGEA